MEAKDVKVGDELLYGISQPSRVKAVAAPELFEDRWRVLVEHRHGVREYAALPFLVPLNKRPSARRGAGPNSLAAVVAAYNEVAPEKIDADVEARALRKVGGR